MKAAAVIVAHPDDEILWCGGLMRGHPELEWTVVTLCRASDPDRAPRFRSAMEFLHLRGIMGDLDDGPQQTPLAAGSIERALEGLLPKQPYQLLVTHGPRGEYTRHRRHEECCRAVLDLWRRGRIETAQLWCFAYDDGEGSHPPRVSNGADRCLPLSEAGWREKRRVLTAIYGFNPDSWEVRAAPRIEGFFCFREPAEAVRFVSTIGTR